MPDNTDPTVPADDTTPPRTLGEYLAARPPSDEQSAVQRLLAYLAGRGGHAFVSEAKRAGHGETAMLTALAEDPDDRRIKPRLAADLVSGEQVIWLTTPGWKACGHPSKREVRPTTQTLAHADAPRLLRQWLTPLTEVLDGHATIEVVTDPAAVAEISEAAKARAWARLRVEADADGAIGSLTSGMRPDALLIERWWNPQTYASAYGKNPDALDPEEAAEVIWAIEVEDSTKSSASLREKTLRHDAAARLGVVRGTIWITRSAATARALAAFGIGRNDMPREGHLAVRSWEIGLPGGEMVQQGGPRWWALTLAQRHTPRTPFGT